MKDNIPKQPLDRIIREGSSKFCNQCGSSVSKDGFLGLFGEYLCHNQNCKNSISKKIYR
jgi:hypothetical protein